MTNLNTRARCWWSMSGLAESQELQWGGAKLGEGNRREWDSGDSSSPLETLLEGGKEEQHAAGLKPL